MNILFIKHFCVGFMDSEIPIVSVLGHCSGHVHIRLLSLYFMSFVSYKSAAAR